MSDVRPVRTGRCWPSTTSPGSSSSRARSSSGVALVSSGGAEPSATPASRSPRSRRSPARPRDARRAGEDAAPEDPCRDLADRHKPDHEAQLAEHGIEPFDLVVVNLYPFRETVASGAGPEDVVEKIDIGGPTMVRAAAKNFESIGVVVSPARYDAVLEDPARGRPQP